MSFESTPYLGSLGLDGEGVYLSRRRVGLERYGEVYASSLLPAIKPAELGHDMIPCGPHCHIDINVRCSLHGITLFFFCFLFFYFLALSFASFFTRTLFVSLPVSLSNHIPRYVFPVNLTSNRIESPSALNFDFFPQGDLHPTMQKSVSFLGAIQILTSF